MAGFSRRDIVHGGLGLPALLGGMAAGRARADAGAEKYYPPGLTGLRGSHVGSFEVAHALAREGQRDFGPTREVDDGYDLVGCQPGDPRREMAAETEQLRELLPYRRE